MAPHPPPERLLAGRYRLITPLRSGGYGRIWRAHDETLGVDVAVKEVFLADGMNQDERTERLERARREGRNAAALRDHPNIVSVHDVVIEDSRPWTVMQLVSGSSLHERLARGPLTVDGTARVAGALLAALDATHRAGILHRDIKPANVMMGDDGSVLLADFGVSMSLADSTLTRPGELVASVEYCAPERLDGKNGKASGDLFSLGATLHHAVEGTSPFHRDTVAGALHAVLWEPPPEPRQAGRLAPLITRLLDKDPDRRPTIAQAVALLDEPVTKPIIRGVSSSPKPPPPPPAPPPVAKTKPLPTEPPPPKEPVKVESRTTATTSAPSGTKAPATSGNNSSGTGWLWAIGIAAVVICLYSFNYSFAAFATDRLGLSDEVRNPKVGDCLHYNADASSTDKRWVEVPCFSAAAGYTILDPNAPSTTAGAQSYTVAPGVSVFLKKK